MFKRGASLDYRCGAKVGETPGGSGREAWFGMSGSGFRTTASMVHPRLRSMGQINPYLHILYTLYRISSTIANLPTFYLDTTASQPVLDGTHQTHCRHYPGFHLYHCHRSGRRAPASKCDEPLRWCRCQCPSLQDSYPSPNPVWDVPFSQEEVQARG